MIIIIVSMSIIVITITWITWAPLSDDQTPTDGAEQLLMNDLLIKTQVPSRYARNHTFHVRYT